MKIKVRPQDFLVEEIAEIPSRTGGDFGLYLLEKSGWNTVDLLKRLSRESGIPFGEFAYGGKKDRHALTRQYVTIKGAKQVSLSHAASDYSLTFLGSIGRPMGPDLIKGNRFEIVLRSLTDGESQAASADIGDLERDGYPNYFDDQRFGSLDPLQGFLAEKILRGHHNGALKIYLTHIRKEDKKEERERKLFFSEHWGKWQECSERAKTLFDRDAFELLTRDPKAFVPLLQRIPPEEMSLFFSSYQSHLWNELLRRIVKAKAGDSVRKYPGVAGAYLFYACLKGEDFRYLRELRIPTPASNTRMPDTLTEKLYAEVLTENHMRPPLFNIRKIRQAFFKGTERKAIALPEGLSADSSPDELYRGKKKMGLKFVLPRGSYGTMLIKRLFCKAGP
ncbi:MAG TPA: tRNA pseudouridine(13) synthase TruD [Thermodesulfovibrionales bacterium]|nr:tRNA pseudouridine(13) synthase TruD [Thermodesulfovibrionales bacterium]